MLWSSFPINKTDISSLPFSTVQYSRSVVFNSLWPHELQHARPPSPSPTPGVHSNSCPSSQWCHPVISPSVTPFSSCPQSVPASESFPMSQLFAWGGQSTGVSALASVLPKKSQSWSPLEWTGWISLQSKGLSRVFSNTTVNLLSPYKNPTSQTLLSTLFNRWEGWTSETLRNLTRITEQISDKTLYPSSSHLIFVNWIFL